VDESGPKGLRGSAPTRIDDKGRLKIPTLFRGLIQDQRGPDVFVTSVTGESVRIYPMSVWLEVEQRLSKMPANHPSRLKFLDRVSYYGQESELDPQGRIVVPQLLRDSAAMTGDVSVLGLQNHLAVWNQKRLTERLFKKEPFTDEDGRVLSGFGI